MESKFKDDGGMEFSSDESDLEQEDNAKFQEISLQTSRLSLSKINRSLTSTGIQNLPPELVFEILEYIDVATLMSIVSFVSRYFYDLLHSSEFWEMRLAECLPCPEDITNSLKLSDRELQEMYNIGLPKAVYQIESARSLKYPCSINKYVLSGNHYGDIHCVKLLSLPAKKIAISGSRDKTICLYDLKCVGNTSECVVHTNADHNGWVWSLDQEDGKSSKIVSGSWDSKIHFYDIGRGSLEKISDVSVHSAILCTRFETNFLLYGTYSKIVAGYDTRSNCVAFKLKNHTRPVLSVASSQEYIWSSGEDNALVCHDRRMNKLLKRIRMERISSSITFSEPYLWVAGYDGFIKCFNEEMRTLKKIDTGHNQPIMDMTHTTGATAATFKDGVVKVFSPNLSPVCWNTFNLDSSASCVDYKDGYLMAGCSDSSVLFWRNTNLDY